MKNSVVRHLKKTNLIVSLIAIAVGGLVVPLFSSPSAFADVLYVAPRGTQGAVGSTAAPFKTIQEALDKARAGDTVKVASGVYQERVAFKNSGAYGKPIVLEGEPGAIIDGSQKIELKWQPAPDIAPGVYRVKVPFNVFTLTADGKVVIMLRENRVTPGKAEHGVNWEWPTLFKRGVGPFATRTRLAETGSGWDGVKALALYLEEKKELIIRFKDDLDPNKMKITVAPRQPAVKIAGVDRCVVRGLTLRNTATGVSIGDSIGSVVEDCTIGPIDFGVWMEQGADRCTVRFNEIFWNPYAGIDPWGERAWDHWVAHKRSGYQDRYGIRMIHTVGGHDVHDNYIHDHWDGISAPGSGDENSGLRVHHNRLVNLGDDALEPHGPQRDSHWHDNFVNGALCGFRIKTVTAGPLYAYRNIFNNCQEDFRNYGEGELQPAFVYVYHNTSTTAAAINSNKVFGIGTPNYHYFNNLFWNVFWLSSVGNSVPPNWKGDYNVYARREKDARWDKSRALATELGFDKHSLWTESAPGFKNASALDFSLTADSPARGRGANLSTLFGTPLPGCEPGYFKGNAPDAGALQFGESMPTLPRRKTDLNLVAAGQWPSADAVRKIEVATPSNKPNFLINGGFEQGNEQWDKPDPKVFKVETGNAAEGENYLSINKADGTRPSTFRRQITGLTPDITYVLSFSSRRNNIADLRIIIRDVVTQKYLASTSANNSTDWQTSTLKFKAPEGNISLEISARSAGISDFDNFHLAAG
jgi:hypothetical protein